MRHTLVLIDSDNTATGVLWKEAGGAPAIMARLELIGAKGIHVSRPISQLMAAAAGLQVAADAELTPAQFEGLLRQAPRSRRQGDIDEFLQDERDTTTPEAYIAMLARRVPAFHALARVRLRFGHAHRTALSPG